MERVYGEQRDFMLRYATSLVGCPHDAEDIVQHAALVMCRWDTTIGAGVSDRAFASYLVRSARGEWARAAVNRAKLQSCSIEGKRAEEPRWEPGSSPSAERTAITRLALQEAAQQAPEAVRAIAAGYTLKEVSAATGTPIGSVWKGVQRWRKEALAARDERGPSMEAIPESCRGCEYFYRPPAGVARRQPYPYAPCMHPARRVLAPKRQIVGGVQPPDELCPKRGSKGDDKGATREE